MRRWIITPLYPFYFKRFIFIVQNCITLMIKFVIPSKEINKQIKSNLRTSIYCKMCLVANMVQDELRNKSTGIIHNELIMQRED